MADDFEKWEFGCLKWCEFASQLGVKLISDASLDSITEIITTKEDIKITAGLVGIGVARGVDGVADIAGGGNERIVGHPTGRTIEKTTGCVPLASIEAFSTIPTDDARLHLPRRCGHHRQRHKYELGIRLNNHNLPLCDYR